MRNSRLFLSVIVTASVAFWFPRTVPAEGGGQPAVTAENRLEELEQKVKILERLREVEQENAKAKAKDTAVLTAGKEGFALKSADGAFQIKLRGYLQTDGRLFLDLPETSASDTFLLRRVRPIFEGTVSEHFDFRIMPDFGDGKTVLQDAYLDAHYWPELRLRAGKFKTPFGLERLQSATDILFVERALPTNLVPNRDLGIQLHGEVWEGAFGYALGIFNGVPDGGSADNDVNDDKDLAGRIFAFPFKHAEIEPLKGLGVGVASTWGNQEGKATAPNLPSFKTPGQQSFFKYRADDPATDAGTAVANGDRFRISPQAYYYWGPFGLLGEYVLSSQDVRRENTQERLENDAWQVAASYVLTGEEASYRGVKPTRPLAPGEAGWGAFELAARFSELRVDRDTFPVFANPDKAARKASAWVIGLNWYLNRNVKVAFNYEQTHFDGGAALGADRETEKVIFTRFHVAF